MVFGAPCFIRNCSFQFNNFSRQEKIRSMKVAVILVFILSLCHLSEAGRREKRTIGTILQYFGFKLVPLRESEVREPQVEKYQFPPQTPRNPKFMRIQTVMPFYETSETSLVASSVSSTTTFMTPTSSEIPQTTIETTTETSSDSPSSIATLLPFMKSASLRIFMQDIVEASTTNPVTEISSASQETLTFTEQTTVKHEPLRIIMQDIDETPQASTPTQFTELSSQSVETEDEAENIPVELTTKTTPSESIEETSQPSDNFASLPLSSPAVMSQNYQQKPSGADNGGKYEFFRSNDVSNQFVFDEQAFGSFPHFSMPPRPFSHPAAQMSQNHFSTSSASMNMNGQNYNYLTYHHFN